jgi:predicted metal-dependent hydrolase
VGECFVICQGAGYKVHVSPVQLDAASMQEAQVFIAQEARDSQQQASANQQAPDDQDKPDAPDLL